MFFSLNKIHLNFFSIISILKINIKIFFFKKKNTKKIIFFYHTRKNTPQTEYDYIENYFKQFNDFDIIYASSAHITSRCIVVKPIYLRFIFGVDIFASYYVSDFFTDSSKRIYIHHDIYDTPLVDKTKEKNLRNRLNCYDYIFIPSKKRKPVFNNLFLNSKKKPQFVTMGEYPRLTFYLKKKINIINNKSIRVIIATSGFYGILKLSIKDFLVNIIQKLLENKIQTVFRPHPSNISDKKVLEIEERFRNNKFFKLDKSKDYIREYTTSSLMITDYSGTAYSFALTTLNPVIFFSPNEDHVVKLGYSKLNYFKDRKKIGLIIKNKDSIVVFIKKILKDKNKFRQNIKNIRNNFFTKKNNFLLLKFMNSIKHDL